MKHLNGLSVLVLGLGDSGLTMARWCANHGAQVRVWDSRAQAPQDATLAAELPAVQRLSGELLPEALNGVQLVLKSPGLAPNDARIAPLLKLAHETGVLVQGELDLFARALADLKAAHGYAPKVVAITGTNGKTTTTSMTGQLIERTGKRVAVAGNIGPTMLKTLADALEAEALVDAAQTELEQDFDSRSEPGAEPFEGSDRTDGEDGDEGLRQAQPERIQSASAEASIPVRPEPVEGPGDNEEAASTEPVEAPAPIEQEAEIEGGGPPPHLIPPPPPGPTFAHLPEVWVLELSSFQLDGVQGFEPSAATVLNLTQDHLDWHGSMEAYAEAKARIFGKTAVMVINRDDEWVEKMVPAPISGKAAGKGRFAKPVHRQVVRFGLEAPTRPGDFGLVHENGIAWLVRAMELDETIKRGTKRGAPVEEEELVIQRLMPADAMRIRGRHNASNALAALALATAIGCPLAPMLHGLREYAGEPHRVEYITTIKGVEAYDDSKGTNVGATVAALKGLGEDKAPSQLVVILGGDGKGQDFAPLFTPVQRHVRAAALIGRDAPAIEDALNGTGVPLQRHDTLEAATRWAFAQAQSGDAVLLSPACASLDMFRNYAHRAEVFIAEVRALAAEAGSFDA
jgi:UDP-N-acetylmuramoylalanine--D-glutamate ligase